MSVIFGYVLLTTVIAVDIWAVLYYTKKEKSNAEE